MCQGDSALLLSGWGATRFSLRGIPIPIAEDFRDLLVGVYLQPFQKRARRRITQHLKFFLFDTGLFLGRNITSHDRNGMRALGDEYPEAARVILYGGDHKETINGIQLIPIAQALPILVHIIWPG